MYRCEANEKKKAFQGREPYGAKGNFIEYGYFRKIKNIRFLGKINDPQSRKPSISISMQLKYCLGQY